MVQERLGVGRVGVDHAELRLALGGLPHDGAQAHARQHRGGEAALEARHRLGVAREQQGDDMAHGHAGAADAVRDRALKAGLLGVGPVDVLLMPVAHQAIHQRPVVAVGFLVREIGLAVGVLHGVPRRLLAAPAAVVDAAVVGVDRAQMGAVGGIRLADLLGQRAATLAAVPDCLLSHKRLDVVVHLERRMEMHVDAVVQRAGVVEAVVEGGGHLLVDGQRHGEDGQNLQIRVLGVAFVDVLQVHAAVPAGAATKRANLKVLEGVVAHERAKGLPDDLGGNSHDILLWKENCENAASDIGFPHV